MKLLAAAAVLCLATGAAGLGAAPSHPPAPAPAAEPTYFESVDVEVVSVEAFVTDRKGRPVTGLRKEDFAVREDGKPVEVTHFFAASEEAPRDAAPAAAAPPSAAPEPHPGAEPPADQRLDLALFIDDRNLTSANRNRILRELRSYFSSGLGPADRVMVASYDGSLRIMQEPTADRAALEAILDKASSVSARGVERSQDLRRLLLEIDRVQVPPPQGTGRGGNQDREISAGQTTEVYAGLRLYAQQRYDEVRATLATLSHFVDSMAGLPGRKALLYLSGGLPLRPAAAVFEAFESRLGRLARERGLEMSGMVGRDLDASPLLQQFVERASADRVTVYALSAPDEVGSLGADSPGLSAWTPALAGTESFDRDQSMRDIAGQTGGRAALNPAEPRGLLERMRRDLATYYSLGYTPPHPHDGKTHLIEVRTRDRSLTVRHRRAYHDLPAAERTRNRTVSALLFGVTENPLGVGLELGRESRDAKGQMQVELTVTVPISNLALVPRDGFHVGSLVIYIGARDGAGRTSQLTRVNLPVRIPNQQLLTVLNQNAAFSTTLQVRDETTILAVGVRDEVGQADSTVRTTYVPGRAPSLGK
ncbi:MAG TPA: VWA domain-containing protein [Thermoanaerobaculia bacterium]|nr:VWA domain-containing protein [Thermoanaerobaculia bacterium]